MPVQLVIAVMALWQTHNPVTGPLPPSLNLQAGAPGYGQAGNALLLREGYACLVSKKYKDPLWAQENLTSDDLQGHQSKRLSPDPFAPDPDLPVAYRATLADYKSSGYDRGHLAPSGDLRRDSKWSTDPTHLQRESFYLSNMVPQNGKLNRGLWSRFEGQVRKWAVQYGDLQIITGPVFGAKPKTIGKGKVAVPTSVYKIIVVMQGPDRNRWCAVEVPNTNPAGKKLSQFSTTISKIEKDTGLSFFDSWPALERDALESGTAPRLAIPGNLK